MSARKRSHDEYEGDNLMGVADTVARLREPDTGSPAADDEGWQKVERSRKKKKTKDSYPSISHSSQSRLQSFIKLSELQNLVLYLLADGTAPKWCSVQQHARIRKVVILMVPGLELGMLDGKIPLLAQSGSQITQEKDQDKDSHDDANPTQLSNGSTRPANPDEYYPIQLRPESMPQPLRPLADVFQHVWPIKTPGDDKYAKMHSPMSAILSSPVVRPKEERKGKGPNPPAASGTWKNQRTPVTEMLATAEELTEEGYTLHPAHFTDTHAVQAEMARRVESKTSEADGWVDVPGIPSLSAGDVADKEIESGSITAGRKILCMDCEMCITSPVGQTPQIFSLTRVSVIDWDGNVVLDEFVKPAEPITDYLTAYSGVTPALLENVTTTLSEIQKKLCSIITAKTILVGHSLNSDLNALRLTHPFIIDTTILFPHPRGPPLKSSLKWLAQKYLSRQIQQGHGSTGHDSVEDARTCLDLVKQKCEKGRAWGTPDASSESIFKRISRSVRLPRHKETPSGDDEPRSGAVIDWGNPSRGYGAQAAVAIGCENDDEVVTGIKRALNGEAGSFETPKNGCDFVWARFRELEAHRGWWDTSKSVDADALRTATIAKVSKKSLAEMVKQTADRIEAVYNALPPCTAFVVYSGSGDPRELREMLAMQQQFRTEYREKKWDQLSIKWTDKEEQKLRKVCEMARRGIAFVTVK